ncbi:hypothetical protein EDD80_11823 [Anseongella ginsenosidimutans]|uniref:Uncharacterized protein n=1 Tax=Anseongella ginsenosidimutans TaxID=496056 RepID=A0A4R3KLP3_9SPHI|nr:hypothetical protein [Anseongella ginsenosidimutans]QEC51967.1 hypothetical protein FRZ59_06220 [Anseongella ginsenosidimutans]TCS84754.1 hypothetical protein EDD80_11823 [Anseongella ginsenosidimutans]
MNKTEEQLDSIEETLQLLIRKFEELAGRAIKFPEIKVPDYSAYLQQIHQRLKVLERHNSAETVSRLIENLIRKIDAIPREIPMRHHHHVETRSRGFVITALILIMSSAMAIGLGAHLWWTNRSLKENDLKYRMIRFEHPKASQWAEDIYRKDPKAARRATRELEKEELAILQAEAEARRKKEEATEAREKLKSLKDN